MMALDADLDGGSIVVRCAEDPADLELALRPDTAADFLQWFHFRVSGARGEPITIRIVNAGEATYAEGWEGYRACASYDGERWFRVPTTFDGSVLTFRHTPERDRVTYAYFAAYPLERHARLLAEAARSLRARVTTIGESARGRPMELVVIGDEDAEARRVWIIARQHPGETMAEWFMEGVVSRLLDEEDPLAEALLEKAVFYLVPNMNPDGAALGNLRTNAVGQNLNEAWLSPSESESPEVACVRRAIHDTGVDLFLDVHGDERTPHVFAAGCEGNPGYSERLDDLEDLFMSSLAALDGSFQRAVGYDLDAPGEADLRNAANYVGERFDCLSLTLEMPFKDDADHPDPAAGWSPERAMRFGRTTLESVLVCVDSLR